MLALLRQISCHDLRLARRLDLAGRQLVANDLRRRRVVDVAVAPTDAGGAAGSELLLGFELAVAVGVAQRYDAAARSAAARLCRHEHVTVRRHENVARASDVVGNDGGAESLRQL